MSTPTTNMSMGKAVDGDNAKVYLETALGAALDKLDVHDHSGTTKALAVPYGSIGAVAWTSFTPSISQPTGLTVTVNVAHYIIIGKWCAMQIQITPTQAGTGGNDMVIGGLPAGVAPLASGAATIVGSALYRGATYRAGVAVIASATTLKIAIDNNVGFLGTLPNVAIANNDTISISAAWELA